MSPPPAHIGPRNACPRAAPETTPLWRLFLIKLSLSLSLRLRVCQWLLDFQVGRGRLRLKKKKNLWARTPEVREAAPGASGADRLRRGA